MPIREPKLLVGLDATTRLAESVAARSLSKVLLVTTAGVVKRGQTLINQVKNDTGDYL